MGLLAWLIGSWRARMRRIDLDILWPTFKRLAREKFPNDPDWMDFAKAMFGVHCFQDPNWMCLGEEEIISRIEALT